jgi:phosphoesterase RecJ-like protein
MKPFELLKNIIEQNKKFLLTTHVNPDADAIGSELAIYFILKQLGKDVRIVNHSSTPYNLEFLDEEKIIERYDEKNHEKILSNSDVIFLLDLNQISRVVRMGNSIRNSNSIKVCIDHHQDPENFYDHFFGGSEYSATGEIIYEFIKQTKIVPLDRKIAYQLYTAIMTDTGSFRFDRTSPKVHRIIAELLEYEIIPMEVYDKVYDQFHFSRIKLLGNALSSLKLDNTKKIAYMILTSDIQKKNNAVEADLDGFVNYCLSIQDVEIGILIYELNGSIKISFRSKGEIPVNKLAGEFGGGGHINASGARLENTTIEDVLDSVLEKAQKYLTKGN